MGANQLVVLNVYDMVSATLAGILRPLGAGLGPRPPAPTLPASRLRLQLSSRGGGGEREAVRLLAHVGGRAALPGPPEGSGRGSERLEPRRCPLRGPEPASGPTPRRPSGVLWAKLPSRVRPPTRAPRTSGRLVPERPLSQLCRLSQPHTSFCPSLQKLPSPSKSRKSSLSVRVLDSRARGTRASTPLPPRQPPYRERGSS